MNFLADVLCKALRIFRNKRIILASFHTLHSLRKLFSIVNNFFYWEISLYIPFNLYTWKEIRRLELGKWWKIFQVLFDHVFSETDVLLRYRYTRLRTTWHEYTKYTCRSNCLIIITLNLWTSTNYDVS